MNASDQRIVVIGAGLAGLTAAAVLAQSGQRVTVLESRDHAGGEARTVRRDGFALSQGPHALFCGGAGTRILGELGIALRGRAPAPDRGRMVFDGQLHIAPGGATTLLRTTALSVKEKLSVGKALGRLAKLRPEEHALQSVTEFVANSVSGTRASELLHAVIRLATYGSMPDVLSADVAISQLQLALGKGVLYLDGGWGQLVESLSAVPGVTIETGAAATELPDAAAVIVATGNPTTTGAIVGTTFDHGPALTVSCLDLGLSTPPKHDFLLGGDVGLYFSNFSAVADVAPPGTTLVCAAKYLAPGEQPDAAAMESFARLAGVRDEHIVLRRLLHRMTSVSAAATVAGGGMGGRPTVDATGAEGVFIAGDWVGPTGHLADASIASGKAAAMAALRHLERAPSIG
jgi:phytoene dehydrogenase-like protein